MLSRDDALTMAKEAGFIVGTFSIHGSDHSYIEVRPVGHANCSVEILRLIDAAYEAGRNSMKNEKAPEGAFSVLL